MKKRLKRITLKKICCGIRSDNVTSKTRLKCVYKPYKQMNNNIITPTNTTAPTTTRYNKKKGEKEEPLRGRKKEGKSNSRHCCLSC